MDFIVRDLTFADLDALIVLYEHLHRRDDPLPSRLLVEQTWQTILDDSSHIYLGGFLGTTLVSACNAAIVANLTRGARPYAVIENVVTAADFRRKGLGSSVLRELLSRCWARRCYKVMLLSGAARSEIHEFYDSLGFDRTAKQAFIITAR